MKSNMVDFFLKLYDLMTVRRRVVLFLTAIAVAISSSWLLRVELDMSFNPFFSNDPEVNRMTEVLQEEFGTRLGAYIAVVIEREQAIDGSFLPAIGAITSPR